MNRSFIASSGPTNHQYSGKSYDIVENECSVELVHADIVRSPDFLAAALWGNLSILCRAHRAVATLSRG